MNIFIANVDNCEMVESISDPSEAILNVSAISARRMVWFMQSDDFIFLPSKPNPEWVSYVGRIKGVDLSTKQFIFPENEAGKPNILNVEQIRACLDKLPGDTHSADLCPYYHCSSIDLLFSHQIGKPIPKSSFVNQGGATLMNMKTIFRALFASKIDIADGYVCKSLAEFLLAADIMLNSKRDIIIKQDKNAGGDGNIAVCISPRGSYPGVHTHFIIESDPCLIGSQINKVWEMATEKQAAKSVVLEEYFDTRNVIYAEYSIDEAGFKLLSYGDLRLSTEVDPRGGGALLWSGFRIPSSIEGDLLSVFHSQCEAIASLCHGVGYRGRINMDAIITLENRLIFTEINGRYGGCSHIHEVSKSIIGESYLDTHVLLSRNGVGVPSFKVALSAANKVNDRSANCGVIIVNDDTLVTGTFEYIVYAESYSAAIAFESRYLELIAEADHA